MSAGLSGCPYYRGEGKCVTGCWQEPECITDEPSEGWAIESRWLLVRLAARLRYAVRNWR